MSEEKQEQKKRSIIRQILKWIGLSVLSLLLIAAIYFQAPWKVITLLVIFLLACTILPKCYRKWFWLSVGVVIIILIIWVFLPDDDEGWRPYTFDEELAEIEAKRAIPDAENAAKIYNELFETPILDGNEPEFLLQATPSARSEPWLSKDHPETAQWLQEHKGTIEKLIQACEMEKCSFPIHADPLSMGQSMDRLASMRRYAYLLVSSANNDIAEGRVDAALEKYFSLIKMADHMQQQSTLIEMLVGIAIEALAIRQFNRFITTGDVTAEHLSTIEQSLASLERDWSSNLPRILEHEKLMTKNILCRMYYEANAEGKTRLSCNPGATIRTQWSKAHYWRRKVGRVGTILLWFFAPSTPQKAGEIIDAAYERYYAMAEPDFDWQKGTEKPTKMFRLNYRYLVEHLAEILAPAYHRIHDLYLRLTSDRRGCKIIIALRRYKNKAGRWPEGMDDVKDLVPAEIFVDPINGGSFVYKLTDDNFTLYSKGKNNIDEGGEYESSWPEESEPDDRLIWPKRTSTCDPNENTSDVE